MLILHRMQVIIRYNLYSDQFAEIELTTLEFNQSGATEMRAWMNTLAMNSLATDSGKNSATADIRRDCAAL